MLLLLLAQLCSPALLVAAQSAAATTACTGTYTIAAGDTCDIIGQKNLVSTYQVMALNLPQAGPDCYSLVPGNVSRVR